MLAIIKIVFRPVLSFVLNVHEMRCNKKAFGTLCMNCVALYLYPKSKCTHLNVYISTHAYTHSTHTHVCCALFFRNILLFILANLCTT